MHETIKFISIGCGIIISFSFYSLLHEKVVKQDYIDTEGNTEKFVYFQALVGFLYIFYFLIGLVCHYIFKESKDTTPTYLYVVSSLFYLGATLCTNYALKWISYPAQVIGKCAKPIPTLILSTIIGKRRYNCKKYLFIFMIVIGIALFIYNKENDKGIESKVWYGEILLLCSLLLDGLLGGFQEKIRHKSAPAPFSMMLAFNGYSSVILVITSIVTGEVINFFKFVLKFPEVLQYLSIMAITGGLGQIFIYIMLSYFGSVSCSVVTTSRKFFTVLLSVIVYGHVLIYYQWIGVIMVFGGLFLDIFFGDNKSNKERREQIHGTNLKEMRNDKDEEMIVFKNVDSTINSTKINDNDHISNKV